MVINATSVAKICAQLYNDISCKEGQRVQEPLRNVKNDNLKDILKRAFSQSFGWLCQFAELLKPCVRISVGWLVV